MALAVIIHGDRLLEALLSLGILGLGIVLAFLVVRTVTLLLGRITARTATTLDDYLLAALKAPLGIFLILLALFVALTFSSDLNPWQRSINKAWAAATLALVFWGLQRAVGVLLTWYGREVATRTNTTWDEQFLPILRRILGFAIVAIGALVILGQLGIPISPLLAGLGIGGLAVALALQPTLSNFISGTYMLTDASIRPGDFIEIQGGPSGTVKDVGWRITRIQTPANNIVTVPNAKLADSIVTNYERPEPAMAVVLNCGVSYESDLGCVEGVCLEEMRRIREASPEAEKTSEPTVLFREFGDSNISFSVVMQARNRAASFRLQHQLVKALHKRFGQEGIEINYPVRKVVFGKDGSALAPASLGEPPEGIEGEL